MRLDQNIGVVDTIQTQVATLTANFATLQHSIEGLTAAIHRRQEPQPDDAFDDFDEGSVVDAAPHVGRGHSIPPARAPTHGHGLAPLGRAQCVLNQPADDGLGKPKFSIPKFDGSLDPEDYLTWELKIEKLWRFMNILKTRRPSL